MSEKVPLNPFDARIVNPSPHLVSLAERLRQAESRNRYLESLLENQQNVYVMRAGFDHTYTYANQAFRLAFDRPGRPVVGSSLYGMMLPEDRPAVDAAGRAAVSQIGLAAPVRIHKILPDGGVMITDWELVAVTDADGNVTELQGMGVDVTEQEHSLTQTKKYKARLEQMLESMPHGFFALDRAGRITYLNATMAEALGRSVQELLGVHLYSLLPLESRTQSYSLLMEVVKQQKPAEREMHLPETGQHIKVTAYPTPDGLAAFWRDITSQRLSEQEVDRQETTLREIAWVQSHKVRAPLAQILGLIRIFNREDLADPGNLELLDMLAQAGGALDEVIHEVVGKTYTGKAQPGRNIGG